MPQGMGPVCRIPVLVSHSATALGLEVNLSCSDFGFRGEVRDSVLLTFYRLDGN